MPSAGPVRSFDFPPVHADVLDNGLRIRSVQVGRLPVVTAMLVLDAGEALLDDSRAGTAVLTGDCLEGGTAKRSGVELAEALGDDRGRALHRHGVGLDHRFPVVHGRPAG